MEQRSDSVVTPPTNCVHFSDADLARLPDDAVVIDDSNIMS